MLQKTFSIYAEDTANCRLFIEAGVKHIACWCKDAATGAIKAFEFFQFDADEKNTINSVIGEVRLYSKLMNRGINPEFIVWEDKDAICVPTAFYREDLADGYLTIMTGPGNGHTLLTQNIFEHTVIARQSNAYTKALNGQFKNNSYSHKFYLLLKNQLAKTVNGDEQNNTVFAIFYPSHFILTAVKNGVLQIIRSIAFSTSDDALYNIMQVCAQYEMPLGSTAIIASGLIDTASNLYNTLYSYLDNFSLQETDAAIFDAPGFCRAPRPLFFTFYI